MIDVNELRKGVTFELEGNLFKILDYEHHKPGEVPGPCVSMRSPIGCLALGRCNKAQSSKAGKERLNLISDIPRVLGRGSNLHKSNGILFRQEFALYW